MATTEDKATKVLVLALAEYLLDVREIAETVGISKYRVGYILHKVLGMKKLTRRQKSASTSWQYNSKMDFWSRFCEFFLFQNLKSYPPDIQVECGG